MERDLATFRHKAAAKQQPIVEGTPLPDLGKCKHYRKSRRWLRYTSIHKSTLDRSKGSSSSMVRLKVIGNEIIKTVGNPESCMVSKLPIIFK